MTVKRDPRKRVIRVSNNAKAGVELSESTAKLMGDENNFIAVDSDGIYLKGNLSFITDGTGIRRGGLFVQMPDMLRMIPSTIVTPIPPQIPIPPISQIASITKDLAFFLALLV